MPQKTLNLKRFFRHNSISNALVLLPKQNKQESPHMQVQDTQNDAHTPEMTTMGKIKTIARLIFKGDDEARKAFIEYHLIRRKYVLSRTSEHFGKDKFEPAPLLGQRLLDVGCGTNRIAQELTLRGADCTCIDPDADVLTHAEHDAQRYGAQISFIQTTVQDLVHKSGQYDVILCLDLIGHCKDSQKAIWAMKKLLAPNGIIVFSAINNTWDSFFYHTIAAEFFLRWVPRGTHRRRNFISPKKLSHMFRKEGLEVSQTVGVVFNPYRKDWFKTGDLSCRYMGVIKHKEL